MDGRPLLTLAGVRVVRSRRALLADVDWEVRSGERWVVLGPNGSGKTTLLRVAGALLWPTAGRVEILGHRLGTVDVRTLRARVTFVSASVARDLRPSQLVTEVVVSGKFGALETWWHRYEEADWVRAEQLLAEAEAGGDDGVAAREFGEISEGERQHVLLARALMGSPELLLLDEPAAGLDLGARERFIAVLAGLAADPLAAPLVLVTHHTEEIPPGITHALLLAEGRVQASGPIAEVLTSEAISRCFSVPVALGYSGGRWWTRAALESAPPSVKPPR
jgi:iron complex transport system ATP-binding protein